MDDEDWFSKIEISGRIPNTTFGDGSLRSRAAAQYLRLTLPNMDFQPLLNAFPDMQPEKRRLYEKIQSLGYREPSMKEPLRVPVVSIEDFFTGNNDDQSIAANLEPHPGLRYFEKELRMIRDEPSVSDVLIDVWHIYQAADVEPQWPGCEFVYIIGGSDEDIRETWRERLRADDILEGWEDGTKPAGADAVSDSATVSRVWWD